MNSGSDPYKPYHFLKECNENFQMHICKFHGFLTDAKRKIVKKYTFLDNLKTLTREGKHGI